MWRLKLTVVTVVVLGTLLFGAAVAFAGWGWNAKVEVGETEISTKWWVENDDNGQNDYRAKIEITLPEDTEYKVLDVAEFERVKVRYDDDLVCDADEIQAKVSFKVKYKGNDTAGDPVKVEVRDLTNDDLLASGEGTLGQTISVMVDIPGDCSDYDEDYDDDDDEDEDEDEGEDDE